MAVDALLEVLELDTDARLEAARTDVRAEADRRQEEGLAAVRAAHARRREEHEQARRAEVERDLAHARLEARREVLQARDRLAQRILETARDLLPAVEGWETWRSALPRELEAALAYLGDTPAVVRCRPAVAEAVREAAAGRPGVDVEPDDGAAPGLLVRSADGRVTVDATLVRRLESRGPRLVVPLVARVEEGS